MRGRDGTRRGRGGAVGLLVGPLALAALLGAGRAGGQEPPPAQDAALARDLERLGAALEGRERHEEPVLGLRRAHADLAARCARLADDAGASLGARRAAVALLGALGDDEAAATSAARAAERPDLRAVGERAAARVGARAEVRRALAAPPPRLTAAPPGAEQAAFDALLARVQAVGGDGARALEALALDPLRAGPSLALRALGRLRPEDRALDAALVSAAGRAGASSVALAALGERPRREAFAAGFLAAAAGGANDVTLAAAAAWLHPDEGVPEVCHRAAATGAPHTTARVVRALGAARRAEAGAWLRELRRAGQAWPPLRAAVLVALARLGELDDEGLVELVAAAVEADESAAREAVVGLSEVQRRAEPLLATRLEAADPDHRLRAARAAEVLRWEGLAAGLAAAARNEDELTSVRVAALLALGRLGDPTAVAALAALAERPGEDEPDAPALRRAALDGLGTCAGRSDAGLRALERGLSDAEPAARRAALRAVAAWADPRAAGALRALLARPAAGTAERVLRVEAAAALGLRDPDDATTVLALRAEDQDPGLALALAAYALEVEEAAAVPALLDLLEHRALVVRAAAVAELRRRRGGVGFGLDPAAQPWERAQAARAWRAWWEQRRAR